MCTRCETVRRRLLDGNGGLLANGYTYPEGYLVQGVGRLTGDDRNGLRLAGLQVVMRATPVQGSRRQPDKRKVS